MNALQWWITAWVVTALAIIVYLAGWWSTGCHRWFLRCTCRTNLPGPDAVTATGQDHRAGELQDEWEQLDPDQAADLLIAEWHADREIRVGPSGSWRSPDTSQLDGRDVEASSGHLELERAWWNDPDLTVWDARLQADRCWEILHVEFPRLRAELCGVS